MSGHLTGVVNASTPVPTAFYSLNFTTGSDGTQSFAERTAAACQASSCTPPSTPPTLFFSQYQEGSSNNKFLQIYNPTSATVALDGYAFASTANAPTTPGVHEYWNSFTAGATIAAGGFYTICHGSADAGIGPCDQTHNYLSNGDDGYCLAMGTESSHTILGVSAISMRIQARLGPYAALIAA